MSTTPNPMYLGIANADSAENISQLTRFKIAIVGRPKVGKSWLASTMPGEKYFFDFDSRKESLAGKANTYVKTYKDANYLKPQACVEMEKDLAMFEYNKTKGVAIPDVYVFDSMTHWVKAFENELMKSVGRLSREVRFGGSKLLIPSGWDVTTAARNHMENIISRAAELGHVICIFHEEPEKDKVKSTPEEPVYTGQYVVHPFYLRTLLSTFNEVWRVEITSQQEYLVTVKPTYGFGASTTLRLDKTEKPDIAQMIEKHKANLKAGK
jgi:hypothetical protein